MKATHLPIFLDTYKVLSNNKVHIWEIFLCLSYFSIFLSFSFFLNIYMTKQKVIVTGTDASRSSVYISEKGT